MTPKDTTLTDYSQQIRSELEAVVKSLIERMVRAPESALGEGWKAMEKPRPICVRLGSILNSHHGYDLYGYGDEIDGIPVQIDRNNPWTITVETDSIEFEREVIDDSSDSGWSRKTAYSSDTRCVTL